MMPLGMGKAVNLNGTVCYLNWVQPSKSTAVSNWGKEYFWDESTKLKQGLKKKKGVEPRVQSEKDVKE